MAESGDLCNAPQVKSRLTHKFLGSRNLNGERESKWEKNWGARGREKEEEWRRPIFPPPISLIPLSGSLIPLSRCLFNLFFSWNQGGGKGYHSGEKLSGSIQMAGKPLNLCCPVQKNFNLFFAIGMFLKVWQGIAINTSKWNERWW